METKLTEEQQKLLENMLQQQTTQIKFRWDENFQRRILGILLTDRNFLLQGKSLISPDYFSNEVHVETCRILFKLFEDHPHGLPDKLILENDLLEKVKEKPDSIKLYYKSEFESLYEFFIPNQASRDILYTKLVNFSKIQSLRIAMEESQRDLKKNPDSEEIWSKVYERFRNCMLVSKNFDAGFQYFTQIDDFFNELVKDDERIDKFTSGFLSIDFEISGGGPRRGEIYAFIALPGVGKSLALVKAAVENVNKGFKVAFVSVEMDWVSISKRFTSAYVGMSYNKLISQKEEVKNILEYKSMEYEDKNRLIVKQFPAGSIDVNDIRAYLNQLELYGFVPDVLIVDYPGEMKDTPGVAVWESKYRIIRDLRGLACEKKMLVFTAMQPNKSASELSASEFIEENNIGASFDMFKPLDGLWSINRTTDEANAQVGRIFIVKSRNGKSRYHFPIEYNQDMLTISEIDFEKYKTKMHNKAQQDANTYSVTTDTTNISNNEIPKKGKRKQQNPSNAID
jgi:replicative DNA helicase